MTPTKVTRFILAAALISLVAVASFNYLVDPFGVFRSGLVREFSMNERFRKMDFLLNRPHQHNAYLLGSSVVGLFDPATATRLSGNGLHYYNLSYLGGTPKESYQSVKALLDSGHPIKDVIVGIDMFAFKDGDRGYGPSTHPHPIITGESPARFISSYLFASSFYQGTMKIAHSFRAIPDIRFNPDADGRYELPKYEAEIRRDHGNFVDVHFARAIKPTGALVWIPERFAEFKELANLLHENGVSAKYFIHPFNHVLTDGQAPDNMEAFRQKIREIVPDVYDFSRHTEITSNNCLYYDPKHYRPVVADKIMETVISAGSMPDRFTFKDEDAQCAPANKMHMVERNG